MSAEIEVVKRLYERSKNNQLSLPPKQGFVHWKCPKCKSKLGKTSFRAPLYAEAGGNEFANKVIDDHSVPPGLYNITMDHFICACGYEYIGKKLDQVEL